MRTLIIRPGGIGDCILSLPAMEHLRSGYMEVWAPSAVVPLIRFAGARSIASTGIDLLGIPGIEPAAALIERLRSFDSIASWYGANRPEFRKCVHALGLPFRFLDALPQTGSGIHAADFFLRQAGGCGTAIPKIHCEQARRANFAAIQPFSGSPKKNWPLERFRELALRLSMPLRWCAGPEEPLEDAVRFDNLYELACWLSSACVYIGNDSGITHLAAAVGTPVVAIFGPSDPAVWAPRGDRVRVIAGRLDEITVDDVLRAAASIQSLPESE